MPDRGMDTFEFRGLRPRNAGAIIIAVVIVAILWGTFVIVPAGHRGVVLLWGSVEKRIMGEGLTSNYRWLSG